MAIPHSIRTQARRMRKGGKSLNDIARTLSQSKSTVGYWCRTIELTKPQLERLLKKQRDAGRIGRLKAAQRKHTERLHTTKVQHSLGKSDVGTLTQRDIFILGLELYWGEGYKRGNEECGFTNSDPAIIMAFISWMQSAYNIQKSDLILRVSINESQKARTQTVEHYWSHITSVPLTQFTRISLIRTPHRNIYPDTRSYFGTLRVKVRRATALRRRIMGSLEEVGRQVTLQS